MGHMTLADRLAEMQRLAADLDTHIRRDPDRPTTCVNRRTLRDLLALILPEPRP